MERAIRIDLNSGHFARGTFLAERAAEVDPDAEEIQVASSGSTVIPGRMPQPPSSTRTTPQTMRELGVEPLAFADL